MNAPRNLSASVLFDALGYGPVWVERKTNSALEQKPEKSEQSVSLEQTAPATRVTHTRSMAAAVIQERKAQVPSQTLQTINDVNHVVRNFDWESLKSHTLSCQSCGLCQTRTQVVFGVGNPSCSLMLIGEAPGEQEDLTGEPFVGKSGQLLDQMLKSIHLDRSVEKGVYIANTLKCRPPGNRNPQPEELKACEPLLRRQIQLIRPKVLLAVGRFAVQWLMGVDEIEGSISSLRNKKHVYKDGDLEIPFIVTYHPSYLLRNPSAKALAWDDLCFLQSFLT